MFRSVRDRGAPVRTRVQPDRPVFLNPSGRRWKSIRAVLLTVLALVIAFVAIAIPRITTSPALDGRPELSGPTADEVGVAPVVGDGPLTRIIRLVPVDRAVYGQDPFTGETLTQLSETDADAARGSDYAVERYGYSAAATKTISLTFDDGPDPFWTPKLLDLLSENQVPATFFVTGEQMVKHPEIIQRLVREGFSLGNHSTTHEDINLSASFRQEAELSMADRIMRAQTGQYASFFRLPYEADDVESIQGDIPGILRAQQLGYVVASHDFDTLDWAYASGVKKGEIPMPDLATGQNYTLLLHDAGGTSRAMTLEYVEKLIKEARAEGYTFHTMAQVNPDIQERIGTAEATIWDRTALHLAQVLFVLPESVLQGLFLLALVTMLGLGVFNTVLALFRAWVVRRRTAAAPTTAQPGVSVLIAAFNEELVITRTVEYVLASKYPVREVIVVDDGSTDGTAAMVRDLAARDHRVRLIQQANSGKWAALNRGFGAVTQPFVVTLDADTLFTPDTVTELMGGFRSPRVGAVAGVIKVGNYSRNVITRWQALEYLTQIGVDRSASALLNAVMVIPGACAAWRKSAVLQAGGYSDATLAEDCDLTLMLHQYGWQVEQADKAVAYTEAPETVDALLKQRVRWMFGTLQATWRHRNMLLRPRYGWLGMLIMPMAVLTVLVPLVFTPFIAIVVVQMISNQGLGAVLLFFGLFSAIYGVMAAVALYLMKERPSHLLMVPLYRLIYEPLRAYLLYASLGTALRGVRLGWNKLARTANMDELATRPNVVQPLPAEPNVVAPVPVPAHAVNSVEVRA
jgi:biofilm PGA synthesis N-glycosyltransferase PgaC